MSLVVQFKNLKIKSPRSIQEHNMRVQGSSHINNENIDNERTHLNISEWNIGNFSKHKELAKISLDEQNKKYEKRRQYQRVKTWGEKTKGKSFVSELVLSFDPEEIGNFESKEFLDIMKAKVESLIPAQMERLIGVSYHFDETTPHLHLTFHNFKTNEKGKTTLDNGFYSKDFSSNSRMNKWELNELAVSMTKAINLDQNLNIELPRQGVNRKHLDPVEYKLLMELPSDEIKSKKLMEHRESKQIAINDLLAPEEKGSPSISDSVIQSLQDLQVENEVLYEKVKDIDYDFLFEDMEIANPKTIKEFISKPIGEQVEKIKNEYFADPLDYNFTFEKKLVKGRGR